VRVGVDGLPVVLLTAGFTGAVLALQTYVGFKRFHAEAYVGSVVALSMLRELAPVLTGLMVAGRSGSAMAAEIGSMRVTEQIDALVSLATDPVQYLFVPRILAGIVVVPMLVVLANALGIGGGYLVAVRLLGANPSSTSRTRFSSCRWTTSGRAHQGGRVRLPPDAHRLPAGVPHDRRAEGVGRSTTAAVVLGSLAILVSDFFLTKVLF